MGIARIAWGVLLLVLVAASVVVGDRVIQGLFGDGDEDLPYSLCPVDRSSTEVVRESQIIEGAQPYSGPGPHQLVVVGYSDANDRLPGKWLPPFIPDQGVTEVDTLELAVCEYQYAVGDEADLTTCSYTIDGGSTVSVTQQSAKYDYRVYEAATGEALASFTVKGVATACAALENFAVESPDNEAHPADPDYVELERRLRPLVVRDLS